MCTDAQQSYAESLRRDLIGSHVGGPSANLGHNPPVPLSAALHTTPLHSLQQVGLPHTVPGITNHHILSVTTLNKDQVNKKRTKFKQENNQRPVIAVRCCAIVRKIIQLHVFIVAKNSAKFVSHHYPQKGPGLLDFNI
jgi:hypothetical protein